jgi:uncharacterized protein (DUF885 family)
MKPAVILLLLAVCCMGFLGSGTAGAQGAGEGPTAASDATKHFRKYLSEDWKKWMQEYPEIATAVGFPGENRRWKDESQAGFDARVSHLQESLSAIKRIDRATLPAREQINYDLYRELLETSVEGLPYGDDPLPFRNVVPGNRWMPLTQMGGIQQDAAGTLASAPKEKVSD